MVPLAFQTLSNGAVSFDMRLVLFGVEQPHCLKAQTGDTGAFWGRSPPSENQIVKVGQQRNLSDGGRSHPHVALFYREESMVMHVLSG